MPQPPPSAEDLGGEAEVSQPPVLLHLVGDRLYLSFRMAHVHMFMAVAALLLPAGAD